jgi:hypothetical protein
MPGPLFNFAAYLGAVVAMNAGQPFILGTVVAWFGLFSPGVVLMFAVRDCCHFRQSIALLVASSMCGQSVALLCRGARTIALPCMFALAILQPCKQTSW